MYPVPAQEWAPAAGERPRPGCGRLLAVLLIAAAAGVLAVVLVVVMVVSAVTGSQGSAALTATAIAEYCFPQAPAQAADGTWSAAEMTDAATIVSVGEAGGVPAFGLQVAVATAMQESHLDNLDHGDRDSLGLFQQRPSQGWGTPAQVMDPVYAAGQFYQRLLAVPGWQALTLAQAAQAVQRSADPGAYAQWQSAAAAVVARFAGPAASAALPSTGTMSGCSLGQPVQGTQAQLDAALSYAASALGTAYQYGGSCTSPRSTDPAFRCDCSSLVQQAFARAGLSLPRTAEQQYEWGLAGHAQVIPLAKAQVGDVVYMPSDLGPDVIGHTGIVIDPAKMTMLDAYMTGQPVEFNSYAPASDPWGSHMLTVLRFILTAPAAGSTITASTAGSTR